jgi:hypothetical protein
VVLNVDIDNVKIFFCPWKRWFKNMLDQIRSMDVSCMMLLEISVSKLAVAVRAI